MGREVRRVPANWSHPKDEAGNFIPLRDGCTYASTLKRWNDTVAERGLQAAVEDEGGPPDEREYMPRWTEAEADHLMMYEDTSEGTPISPAFKTPEGLARWLADTGASAFGGQTATFEQWLRVARSGWAPSAILNLRTGRLVSGVAGDDT